MQSKELGDRLRDLRKGKGYSLQNLADLLGLSPQAISQYELNKREIPMYNLRALLFFLGLNHNEVHSFINSIRDIPDNIKKRFLAFHDALIPVEEDPKFINTENGRSRYFVEKALEGIGYQIGFDEDDACMWLENGEHSFEVTEKELLDLARESAEFLRFKIEQLSKGKRVYPKSKKK